MIILRTQVAVSEIWMTSCIYCGRYILMRWTHNHLTMRRSLHSLHSLVNFKNKKHSHAISLEVPEFQQLPVVLCRTTAMVKQTRHLTCSRKMISVTSLMTSQWSKLARRSNKKVHIRRDSYVFYDLKHSGL